MTDKNIKHGKRNSDYWDRLIERYYSGNTTIDEEKELSRFVFSESQNKRYDEIGSSPRFSACIFSLRHLLQLFFRFWQYVISDLVQDHGTYRLFLFMFQGIAAQ